MNWYIEVLKKYAEFRGRARRQEYWIFVAVNALITYALMFVDLSIGTFDREIGLGIMSGFYTLAVIVPSIAVGARRLHDIGRSAWWLLIVFIPILGVIALIVLFALDSKPGSNEFGENPKGISA